MKPTLHICATAAALALFVGACTSSTTESPSTGGTVETGGTVGSGGAVGAGGTGGTVGSGGTVVGSGGKVGTGGATTATPTGGKVGSGGAGGGDGGTTGAGGTGAGGTGPGRDAGGRDMGAGMGGRTTGSGGSTGSPVDGGGVTPTGGNSAGCGSSNTTSACGAKGTTCKLTVNSKDRTYYVQLPSGYSSSKQYPVIFQFHPWGGSADQALTEYNISKGIPDAIYITPQGLDAGGNGPGWANTGGEDIAFTKAMLADVQSKYCTDNAHIFSVGFSYGGMMSFAIACEMSDVFRGIAPMSGSLYSDTNCKGTGPHIAMWGTHGTTDTVVPTKDGEAARDKVLKQNHCGTTTQPVDPSPCVKYDGCDPGYDVTWCEFSGGHQPASFGTSGATAFFKSLLAL